MLRFAEFENFLTGFDKNVIMTCLNIKIPNLHILLNLRRFIRQQLHGAIYRPDSFVLMLRYCANLKAIRYESTSLNRILANKSHRIIVP